MLKGSYGKSFSSDRDNKQAYVAHAVFRGRSYNARAVQNRRRRYALQTPTQGKPDDMLGSGDRAAEDTSPPVLVSVSHVSAAMQRFFARIAAFFHSVLVAAVAMFLFVLPLCSAARVA